MDTLPAPTTPRSRNRWTKKLLVGGAVAGAVLGSTGLAMAATGEGPSVRSSLGLGSGLGSGVGGGKVRSCVKAKAPADRAARKAAVQACLTEAGVDPAKLAEAKAALQVLKGATHADVTVPKEGGYEVVQVDRGTLTSSSADSVVVTRADGPVVTLSVGPSTKVFGADSIGAIATGSKVTVVSSGGAARGIGTRA